MTDASSTPVSAETATADLLKFINSEVSVSPEEILADSDLLLSGAVDSLGVVRITQWMEDELGMEIDPTEVTLENFQTVQRMVAFCQRSSQR